jgi:ankyrin repeat protein
MRENLKNAIRQNNIDLFKGYWDICSRNQKDRYLSGEGDEGRDLLSWAAITANSQQMMEYLISIGSDVNHQDGKSRTSLSGAVEYNYLENVRFLLQHGANANLQDFHGNTTLHVAAHGSGEKIVELLFTAGADISIINNNGCSAIHVAAKSSLEALHAIVHFRGDVIDINQRDNNGETPLHWAAQAEDGGINAGFLLRCGANRTILDNEGHTAIQAEEEWSGENTISHVILAYNNQADFEEYYQTALVGQTDNYE